MHSVLLLGAGKIGRMIAKFLSACGDYRVTVADTDPKALTRLGQQSDVTTREIDADSHAALASAMAECDTVVSALSYRFNPGVARAAAETGTNYFDLTEDVETTRQVRSVATEAPAGTVFMPQCGLAPGFISIVARHLTDQFDSIESVHMRVGALPQFPTNAIKYNLTWSTDGLINEYCNLCEAIHDGRRIEVLPLEGLEHFSLDGVRYEAFNTSGGLGTLCETLDGRVRELNYKTIRYLGHRDLTAFLVNDLQLGRRRDVLKDLLETAIPITFQDVVVIFCTVTGHRNGHLVQQSDARKVYQQTIDGEPWSAIQLTTAAGICTVIDLQREGKLPDGPFLRQEDVPLATFLDNRFGQYYQSQTSTRFANEMSDLTGASDD
jgi:saccharopine dehydrogenase-like NADP-dependent oxidoreductase